MLHTHMAALVLAATTFAVSGCGASSKTVSTNASTSTTATAIASTSTPNTTPSIPTPVLPVATGKPLTRSQWIIQGDTICAHLLTQLAAQSAQSQQQLVLALTQAAAYERAELVHLAKIVPPTSKENDWQQYLTGFQEVATNSAAEIAVAQAGKFAINSPLAKTTLVIKERIDAIAKHDGFKRCSRL